MLSFESTAHEIRMYTYENRSQCINDYGRRSRVHLKIGCWQAITALESVRVVGDWTTNFMSIEAFQLTCYHKSDECLHVSGRMNGIWYDSNAGAWKAPKVASTTRDKIILIVFLDGQFLERSQLWKTPRLQRSTWSCCIQLSLRVVLLKIATHSIN